MAALLAINILACQIVTKCQTYLPPVIHHHECTIRQRSRDGDDAAFSDWFSVHIPDSLIHGSSFKFVGDFSCGFPWDLAVRFGCAAMVFL
jgi:hypothetical protein